MWVLGKWQKRDRSRATESNRCAPPPSACLGCSLGTSQKLNIHATCIWRTLSTLGIVGFRKHVDSRNLLLNNSSSGQTRRSDGSNTEQYRHGVDAMYHSSLALAGRAVSDMHAETHSRPWKNDVLGCFLCSCFFFRLSSSQGCPAKGSAQPCRSRYGAVGRLKSAAVSHATPYGPEFVMPYLEACDPRPSMMSRSLSSTVSTAQRATNPGSETNGS